MPAAMAQLTGSHSQKNNRLRSPVTSATTALFPSCSAGSFLRPPILSISQPRQSAPTARHKGRYAAQPVCASKHSRPISRGYRNLALVVPALWSRAERAALSAEQASPAAADSLNQAGTFAPQFNPGVLIVCLIAAAPPILFWGRIFFAAWKRQREADKEAEQQNLKQKDRDVSVNLTCTTHALPLLTYSAHELPLHPPCDA